MITKLFKPRYILVGIFIGAISFFVWWLYTMVLLGSKLDEMSNNMSANVGKQIVLGKDTLVITDYSTVMENYTLSNGATIDKSFVDNQNK